MKKGVTFLVLAAYLSLLGLTSLPIRADVVRSVPPSTGAGGVTTGASNAWTGTNQFSGATELDGILNFGGTTSAFPICSWNTIQTPDSFTCGLGTTSRALVLHEAGDEGFDFAHAQQTNPTLFIHSSAQSTTQWLSLFHQSSIGWFKNGTASGFGFQDATGSGETILSIIGGAAGVEVESDAAYTWSNLATAADNPIQTYLTSPAAATVQLGTASAASPVAQTLQSQGSRGGTDSNVAGSNLTIRPGNGTGTGGSGNLIMDASVAGSTGTTANTYADRDIIVAKSKALTAASATSIFQVSVASGAWTGGELIYTVAASDATDHQARSGVVHFAVVNKAGTETCAVYGIDSSFTANPAQTQDGSGAGAISSGTLTYTWGVDTSPTNACILTLNAASSLVETTLEIYYRVHLNGPGTITPQ